MSNRYFEVTVLVVTGLWLSFPAPALACEMCFGAASESEVVAAIASSMLILVLLTGVIGGGVFAFFRNMTVRGKRLAQGRLIDVDAESHLRTNGHQH